MIALVMGVVIGLGLALLLGRLKDRKSEAAVALLMPLLTYQIAEGFHGGWSGNVFISTPFGDYPPEELVGLETFLSLLVALVYVHLRARKAFEIDEFISFSMFSWAMIGLGIGLSASAWPLMALLGAVLYGLLLWSSKRNPFAGLKAIPCTEEFEELVRKHGFKCLTDENSLGVYRVEGHLLIGGGLKNFPRWQEVVECVAKNPKCGNPLKVGIAFLYFLPIPVGIALGDGVVTALVLLLLAVLAYLLAAFLSVKAFQRALPKDCGEVMSEYKEFFRRNKKRKKTDIVIT